MPRTTTNEYLIRLNEEHARKLAVIGAATYQNNSNGCVRAAIDLAYARLTKKDLDRAKEVLEKSEKRG